MIRRSPPTSFPPFRPGLQRSIVLVDGEHYPPVVRAAIAALRAEGREIVGAVLLGGTEKLAADEAPDYGVSDVITGATMVDALHVALERSSPDEVVDLSDAPVLDARTRMLLAAHAISLGVRYVGAGFAFDPPSRERVARKPSIAVIGTGKRTGKTAISGAIARALAADGRAPVVVAMGRGGPAEPELIDPASSDLSPAGLLALANAGRHAASDHLEDAVTSGVVTIGTRRCGGGLGGLPGPNTFREGVEVANRCPERVLVLEGSGSAIPPVHADATVCVIPGTADPELVAGYLGGFPLLLADLVVVTLLDEPQSDSMLGSDGAGTPVATQGPAQGSGTRELDELERRIREIVPEVPVLHCVLRPWPLGSISQRSVFFASTAPEPVVARLAAHLETQHGATVVGWSSHLARRGEVLADLEAATGAEVMVTELKAAAVDVVTRVALERGMEVVYCDNRPVAPGADRLDAAARRLADAASRRFDAGVS